ncbi:MAG TPA: hypothetical protein VNS58_32320 [Puia sp.]|nr:hypothetical protein [Puia sp.]
MEDFTITSRLTTKQYAKVMFLGLYKKPAFILATLIGLYYIVTLILDYFKIINYYSDTPYFEIFCGLFLFLSPTLIVIISVRQFLSNASFKNDIKYTFGEKGMAVEGLTFKGEFLWTHIIKQKEVSNFLILYHSKKMGNFIDKTKLTLDQLQYIKTKVGQK